MCGTGPNRAATATTQPSNIFNSAARQHQRPQHHQTNNHESMTPLRMQKKHATFSNNPERGQTWSTTCHKHAQFLTFSQPAHQRPPRHQCPRTNSSKQPAQPRSQRTNTSAQAPRPILAALLLMMGAATLRRDLRVSSFVERRATSDNLWTTYRQPIDNLWTTYGQPMDNLLCIHQLAI